VERGRGFGFIIPCNLPAEAASDFAVSKAGRRADSDSRNGIFARFAGEGARATYLCESSDPEKAAMRVLAWASPPKPLR